MDPETDLLKLFIETMEGETMRLREEQPAIINLRKEPGLPRLETRGGRTTWEDLAVFIDPIEWDWHGWLPRGFLTVLASKPGMGKSLLCMRLAACYLAGWDWPDGRPFGEKGFAGQQGEVIWCEGEASQSLNLERARSWGLPLKRFVFPLDHPLAAFQMGNESHMLSLLKEARGPNVRLVVLDSLSSLMKGESIPQALDWLGEMARIAGQPILLTHHLRKGGQLDREGGVDLEQLRGTSMIAQMARVVWTLDAPDTADPEHRRLAVAKNNLMLPPGPIGMRIDGDGLHFDDPPEPTVDERITKEDVAKDFLIEFLGDGVVPSADVMAAAERAGLPERTLWRAKRALRVRSKRMEGRKEWGWYMEGGSNG